jgi:hypothetical protein
MVNAHSLMHGRPNVSLPGRRLPLGVCLGFSFSSPPPFPPELGSYNTYMRCFRCGQWAVCAAVRSELCSGYRAAA